MLMCKGCVWRERVGGKEVGRREREMERWGRDCTSIGICFLCKTLI